MKCQSRCWQEERVGAEHTRSRRSEMKMTLRICFRRLGGRDGEAILKGTRSVRDVSR